MLGSLTSTLSTSPKPTSTESTSSGIVVINPVDGERRWTRTELLTLLRKSVALGWYQKEMVEAFINGL
jgi:hypothetical protein